MGAELKQRDALSARARESELVIAAKRQRLDELHAAELAAERRRAELRAEEARAQNWCKRNEPTLAAQVRAAYMIGPSGGVQAAAESERSRRLGRTLAYYGYFAQRAQRQDRSHPEPRRRSCRSWSRKSSSRHKFAGSGGRCGREIAGLQRARAERSEAVAALTKQLSSGNQQLARLKREEQAVESLVAELARVMQDFPVDATQSFAHARQLALAGAGEA